MALNQEIKERIFAAANELHATSGEIPNVESVRQLSRAGMNAVVEAMREWRSDRRRSKQMQTPIEPLPTELHDVLQTAGQKIWQTAQKIANESLESARIAFESEKADLAELSAQQSDAFESQTGALEAAQARIVELETQTAAAVEQQQKQALELAELRAKLDSMARVEREREKAREDASTAREDAAKLRGELEAFKTQNAALLSALKPAEAVLKPEEQHRRR